MRRKKGDKCDWLKRQQMKCKWECIYDGDRLQGDCRMPGSDDCNEDQRAKARRDEQRFDTLKDNIDEDTKDIPVADIVPIPILHNADLIILQYSGWSINLYPDGTYWVQVTEGG